MGDTDFQFYLSLLSRRLPYIILIATAISAVGISIAYLLPPVYRATSTILVESPQIPEELARSTVPVSGLEQIQIIEQQLMTDAQLKSLAEKFNVYKDTTSLSASNIAKNMKQRMTFEQVPFTLTRGGTQSAALDLSFDANDPDTAARVARELTNLILEENVRLRTGQASDTLQFFEQDVKRLSMELSRLEKEILEFKSKNKDALPNSLEFQRSEQSRLQERLLQLEREEAELRDRRNTLVKIFESGGRVAVDHARPATLEEQMLEGLRRKLVEQLAIYSEQSPNIQSLRSQIEKIENEVRGQQASRSGDKGDKRMPTEFDIQIAEIDGRLAFIAQERTTIGQTLAEITASILVIPANEVMLNAMERSYQNVQSQYNAATAKLAEASTGEQIELRSKGARFSVIEMASPPHEPRSSKRLAIAGGSMIAGLGAGLGLFVLLELLNRTIRRPADLVQQLDIYPFATIPYIASKGEKLFRAIGFAAALLIVASSVPASIFAMHHYYMPVDVLLMKFVRNA
jgi:uncharacterized protein involved in exopolysaccharide biosynthesis